MTARTVVLGGGLTGLVTAERLEACGHPAVVLEREAVPGGACRTEEQSGFVFDYTGHLLHISQDDVAEYLRGMGIWDQLVEHERRAAIFIAGRTTPYPIQIHTQGLPPRLRRECLLGFIKAWASPKTESTNFRDWVLDRFGAGLGECFFFPYNEKLYRAKADELSLDWVGRYVPKPDLEAVIDGALGLHDSKVGYNATFRYPDRGGIRLLADAIAQRVNDLRLRTEVVGLNLSERWVKLGDGSRLEWDAVVATFALPFLVDLVVDDLPDDVLKARAALRWVRVLNIALGVDGQAPCPEHWLYFPEQDLPFYRVGFPSNHGRLAPAGHHTVSIEISLDSVMDVPVSELAEQGERALAAAGLLKPEAVRTRLITVLDPSYVVFDHNRRDAVALLRRFFLDRGVRLAGRWAEWKYSAMEDAVLDGWTAARWIAAAGS